MSGLYAQDSFFTLSVAGRIGLGLLSGVLAAAVIWLSWRMTRRARPLIRLAIGVLVFWLFVWLSPQIYYLYYLLILDGLPLQWVIRAPPSPGDLIALVGFSGRADLSRHAQGLLGWACMVAALWPQRHAARL